MFKETQAPVKLPPTALPIISLFGMALLALGAGMVIFCSYTLYQFFTAPQDIELIKLVVDHTQDADSAISGTFDGKEFSIHFSEGVRTVLFAIFMIMGFGALIGAFSSLITAGAMIMKLAYGQPLYAHKPTHSD